MKVLVVFALCLSVAAARLLIGAFNCQDFSPVKLQKPAMQDVLVKIVKRYDVLFMQEISDTKEAVAYDLLNAVNQVSKTKYNLTLSPRLGSTAQKEQYGYFYKTGVVNLLNSVVYANPEEEFERPPFIASFASDKTVLGSFTLVGIHTRPKQNDASREIMALKPVLDAISQPLMLFGDLNADFSRNVSKTVKDYLGTNYKWMLDMDTAVKSDAHHDKLIASTSLAEQVVPDSNTIFVFHDDKDIAKDMARGAIPADKVSDHYPIEFRID